MSEKQEFHRLLRKYINKLRQSRNDAESEEESAPYGSEWMYSARGEQAGLTAGLEALHEVERIFVNTFLSKDGE